MKIKAAIFDMDGTLIDSLNQWNVFWARLGEKYLGDSSFLPSEEDDKKVRTLTLKDAMELIHNNYGIGTDGAELLTFSERIDMEFYTHDVALKPGVREFLEHCKNNGVKMCIASATATELIHAALRHCNIEQYFSKIFSCDTIGKGKEHPDIFLSAVDFFGEDKKETWVFEDSFVAIQTATKIGIPTVGIYDPYNYDQDQIKAIATEYIGPDETLLKLISKNK